LTFYPDVFSVFTIQKNIMRNILLIISLSLTNLTFAQSAFPDFLQGTWKMENKEIFEHWDLLNDNSLKGFSYSLKNGQMTISEYLDISRNKNEIIYTAAVLNQNQGKGINFRLTKSDNLFIFENPGHDFPQKIIYQKLSDTEMFVRVLGDKQTGFSYRMKKHPEKEAKKDTAVSNPNYDPALAKKLGADDYGMKQYVLVILTTGPNQTTDKALINESFRGHMDNINRLAKEGKLIVAGPLGNNNYNYRGIFILNVASVQEAEKILQTDPAVKEKLLDSVLIEWYGSAALPEYLDSSDKIWKINP